MFAVGIGSTLVMAVGTGLTVALLATLAVSAHGFATRIAGADSVVAWRVVRGLEIAAALLVLALGIVLLGGAIASGVPGLQ
jgi:ABC-type nickel/cobalt efflux system permease component RcnA